MPVLLLTGASGFIGKHLIKLLESEQSFSSYDIVLLSNEPVEGYTTIIHKNYQFTQDDFIQLGILKIDIVIHAGAFTPKNTVEADDILLSSSNIHSVNHLITHLPSLPKKFIFLSTLDVYKPCNEPLTEKSATEPVSMYGWAKLYNEKLLEVWAKKNNVVLQVLRIGHIYGSGEGKYQKLIPLTIEKARLNQSPEIISHGTELRSFLHVKDCVNAIISSLNLHSYSGPINVASSRPLPVTQIVEVIVKNINKFLPVNVLKQDIPVRNIVFDNSKMRQLLCDEKISFEEGIKEEIENG
jgi:UDP-glucose 4-epimerase